jgi:hypothetical protein
MYMDKQPNTTAPQVLAGKPGRPAVTELSPLTARQERFAQQLAMGATYSQAFENAGCIASTSGSRHAQIQEIIRMPHVQRRVHELRAQATPPEDIMEGIRQRREWLRLIVSADPAKISNIRYDPCDLCWLPDAVAAAFQAYFTADPFSAPPSVPDIKRPNPCCVRCKGEGLKLVSITPTEEWGPAERALFKSAKQNEKGVIEVQLHDQQAAADMLNKLDALYVAKSLNINANVNVASAKDVDPADGLKLFEVFNVGGTNIIPV